MMIIHNFGTKRAKTSGSKYKVRRAKCTVCDYTELVTGSGGEYEQSVEKQAVDIAKNIYK